MAITETSYINSSQIVMFPSGFRSAPDTAANLTTEENLRRLSLISSYKGNNRCFFPDPKDDTNFSIIILDGYYFRIANTYIPKCKYAYIKTRILNDQDYLGSVLNNIENGSKTDRPVYDLDEKEQEGYKFKGLGFTNDDVTSDSSVAAYIQIRNADESFKYSYLRLSASEIRNDVKINGVMSDDTISDKFTTKELNTTSINNSGNITTNTLTVTDINTDNIEIKNKVNTINTQIIKADKLTTATSGKRIIIDSQMLTSNNTGISLDANLNIVIQSPITITDKKIELNDSAAIELIANKTIVFDEQANANTAVLRDANGSINVGAVAVKNGAANVAAIDNAGNAKVNTLETDESIKTSKIIIPKTKQNKSGSLILEDEINHYTASINIENDHLLNLPAIKTTDLIINNSNITAIIENNISSLITKINNRSKKVRYQVDFLIGNTSDSYNPGNTNSCIELLLNNRYINIPSKANNQILKISATVEEYFDSSYMSISTSGEVKINRKNNESLEDRIKRIVKNINHTFAYLQYDITDQSTLGHNDSKWNSVYIYSIRSVGKNNGKMVAQDNYYKFLNNVATYSCYASFDIFMNGSILAAYVPQERGTYATDLYDYFTVYTIPIISVDSSIIGELVDEGFNIA